MRFVSLALFLAACVLSCSAFELKWAINETTTTYGPNGFLQDPLPASDVLGKCCCSRHHIIARSVMKPAWNNIVRNPAAAATLKGYLLELIVPYLDGSDIKYLNPSKCSAAQLKEEIDRIDTYAKDTVCQTAIKDLFLWNVGAWFIGPKSECRADDPGSSFESGAWFVTNLDSVWKPAYEAVKRAGSGKASTSELQEAVSLLAKAVTPNLHENTYRDLNMDYWEQSGSKWKIKPQSKHAVRLQ